MNKIQLGELHRRYNNAILLEILLERFPNLRAVHPNHQIPIKPKDMK